MQGSMDAVPVLSPGVSNGLHLGVGQSSVRERCALAQASNYDVAFEFIFAGAATVELPGNLAELPVETPLPDAPFEFTCT